MVIICALLASRPCMNFKGVGQNLSDHVATEIQQECTQPISLLRELRPLNIAKSLIRYALTKTGPIAHPGIQAVSFIKSRPDIVAPDIQIHFIMLMYGEHGLGCTSHTGFSPSLTCRPERRWHRVDHLGGPDKGAGY